MKKAIFIMLALVVVMTGYAQRINNTYKSICVTAEKPNPVRISDGSQTQGIQFNKPESIVRSPRQTTNYDEYCIMTTNYDLQSNSALGNRIAVWPDGKASVVATWDHSGSTSFPDRGAGYNYFNGYNFGDEPEIRQEPVKSGWPSIAACGNGEILASHATGVNVYYRPNRGQGSWTLRKNFPNMTWPRIAVSGSNDQYVHLVAAYQESNGSGYINHIYYARSSNNGQTWSDPIALPLVDNSANGMYRNQLGADDYVIAANGNNVAILLGSYTTEVFYIISHDNGQTWSKQVVAPFPIQGVHAIDFADYPNGMTDTINTSDNSHSIAIDNNGVVHVAFGLFHWKVSDGGSSYSYWPAYGYGIAYWNSNYINEQGGHEIPLFGQASIDVYHPEWVPNHLGWTLHPDRIEELSGIGNNQANLHVFGYIDENGNGITGEYENVTGATWHYRSLGLATMPAVSVDESGRLAIIYSVWSETRISAMTGFSYRSAYVTYRDQYGQWCDDAINLSEDFVHEYGEAYPTFASPKGYNGTFWMGYSEDEYQGLYLDISDTYPNSNNAQLTENYIYAVKVSPWGNISNYTITVSANPTYGGTVSGGGTYSSGSNCTIHATPNNGYQFVKWTKNGSQVSTNPNYSFTVTENASYVAHFQQSTTNYTITATVNPSNSGTVTGTGTYASGSTCTLQAWPNNGYTFVNWLENGVPVSTNPTYSFTVTGNRYLVAVFDISTIYYTITASAEPANGGSVSGDGTYASGSTCTLHATPNSGYSFEKWTKNGTQVSTNPDYSFTVTSNASYVAHFSEIPQEYTITAVAEPAQGGAVSGAGIYPAGSTCVLTAMPNEGYVFENWTRGSFVVSTDPSYSFVVNDNVEIVAHFTQDANHFTITAIAAPVEGGAISGSGTYEMGTTCTLNAIAAVGYEFVKWTLNGSQVSTEPSFSFTVTSNAVYTAHFERIINHYTVAASVEPAAAGSVSGTGTYQEGATCTLTATANPTYSFVNWTENGVIVSTNHTYSFTVNSNRSFVATFSQGQFFTITASASDNGTISPEGDVFVEPGADKTFAMIPNSGCRVGRVIVDGVDIGPVESYTFRSVNSNHSIYVQFSGVGVDENQNANLKVYPNPAKESLVVEGEDMKRVAVFNLLGVQMASQEVNDSHTTINTNGFIIGTYILKVEYTDGKIGYSRFVVAE